MSDSTSTKRTQGIYLRLPIGLARQLRERSDDSGVSINRLGIQAVQGFLGVEPVDGERFDGLASDLTLMAGGLETVVGEVADVKDRLRKLEQLAERSGAYE